MLKINPKLFIDNNNFLKMYWHSILREDQNRYKINESLFPCSDEFYHPTNPVFSFQINTEKKLEIFKSILLKDGALSLVDFFLRFPIPKPDFPQIIVEKNLSFLVPPSWREQTSYYEVSCNRKIDLTNAPIEHVVIWGILSKSFSPQLELLKKSKELIETFSPKKISLCLMSRHDLFFHNWDETLEWDTFRKNAYEEIGNNFDFIKVSDLKNLSSKNIFFQSLSDIPLHIGLCSFTKFLDSRLYERSRTKSYQGGTFIEIHRFPLSFNSEIILYEGEASHNDFTNLLLQKKLSHFSQSPGVTPLILNEINNLLKIRLE